MSDQGTYFSPDDNERIATSVKWVEQEIKSDIPFRRTSPRCKATKSGDRGTWLNITSLVVDGSGYYTATISTYAGSGTWTDTGSVKVKEVNGKNLGAARYLGYVLDSTIPLYGVSWGLSESGTGEWGMCKLGDQKCGSGIKGFSQLNWRATSGQNTQAYLTAGASLTFGDNLGAGLLLPTMSIDKLYLCNADTALPFQNIYGVIDISSGSWNAAYFNGVLSTIPGTPRFDPYQIGAAMNCSGTHPVGAMVDGYFIVNGAYGYNDGSTTYRGVDGTLGDGSTVIGGIVTSGGTGYDGGTF